jgi:hypothetical protein
MSTEINEIDDKLVSRDENGYPDNVYYQDIVVYLVEEVKKLKLEIESLKLILNKS